MIHGKKVPLLKSEIDRIFEEAQSQSQYTAALYKLAYKGLPWNQLKLYGWPHVSTTTGVYIFEKAIHFDVEVHPKVLRGGLWMNQGFGSLEELQDWEVWQADYDLEEVSSDRHSED